MASVLQTMFKRNTFTLVLFKPKRIAIIQHCQPSFLLVVNRDSTIVRHLSNKGGTSVTSQVFTSLQLKEDKAISIKPGSRDGETENLVKDIIHVKSTENLAEILETSLSVYRLTEKDIYPLFNALHKVLKGEKSNAKKKELFNSVGMQKVMKAVKQYSRWLNPQELINIIKLMVNFNIPGTNPLLQTILRILSKQANSLSLSEIVVTSFLLEKLNPSPLVTALQVALPVVFESHLSLKLDKTDSNELINALYFAIKHSLSDTTVQKLIDDLDPTVPSLTSKQCMSIIWSLSDSKRRLRSETVVTAALQRMADSYDELTMREISTTISKISKKYSKLYNYFYCEDFVGKFCNTMSEKRDDTDDEKVLYSIRHVEQMRHVDIAYLDRVSEIVLSNPSILLNNDYIFSIVLRAFSSANYKPDNWNKLEPILLNHPFLTKDPEISGLSTVVDFLSLDSFPSNFISKLFSHSSFHLLEQYVKLHSPYIPLLILKSLKLCYPEYTGALPPLSMIADWKNMVMKIPKNYPLKAAIQTGIGGPNYVLTGLFHEGFHIDHAVAYRKGGYPVSLDVAEPVLLEELQLPSESNIVMIKALMPESYATNTNRLRGIYAFELKLIEKLGYSLVAIDTARWKELMDAEKVPYLMHRIREKMDLTTDY